MHWQYTLALLLKDQLRQIQAIRVAPDNGLEFASDESADFGMRELQGKDAPGLPEIVKVGKAVEARKVLWSAYDRKAEGWYWRARLVDVPTGTKSDWLKASSTNSWGVVCRMRDLVLEEMHVKLTALDLERMNRRPTASDEAMELTSRALYEKQLGGRVSSVHATLTTAVKLDPGFALAREALAGILLVQNRVDEAVDLLRHSIQTDSASPREHYIYAGALRAQDLNALARDQLWLVHEALPSDPMPWIRLGELSGRGRGDWAGAVPLLDNAVKLEPYSVLAHEELGVAYAHLGKRDAAISELAVAERFDSGFDGLIAIRLAEAYDLVDDAPHAIPHYERFLAVADSVGLTAARVDGAKELTELRRRLQPHFVEARKPRTFSSSELEEALQAALTRDERTSLTNPFSVTSDMVTWARELGRGAETEPDKAHHVYSGLVRHLNSASTPSRRTAEQAFQDWAKPQASLNCEDYTFLFVVLARELGLKAFCVQVNRDYQSNLVSHACAAVFVDGKCMLVDPAYQWFGAPHIDFEVLNDIETIGFYMAQSSEVAQKRTAVKLLPGRAFPLFSLAAHLASNGQLREAQQVLQAGLKLDQNSWVSLMARGEVELFSDDARAAVKDLKNALQFHPLFPELRYYLAKAYQADHKLEAARDEYRSFVENQVDPELARDAWDQITRLNTALYKDSSTFEKVGPKRNEFEFNPNH